MFGLGCQLRTCGLEGREGLTDTQNLSNSLDLISELSSRTNELARDVNGRASRGSHAEGLKGDGGDSVDHGKDGAAMNRLLSAHAGEDGAHVVVVEVLLSNLHARVDGTRNGFVDHHLSVSVALQACCSSSSSRYRVPMLTFFSTVPSWPVQSQ